MQSLLAFLHQRLAIALVAYSLILGLWGTVSFIRSRQVSGGYRSSYLIMAALTAVQDLVGAGAYAAGPRPRETLHVVYGIFAIAFLPAVFVFASGGARGGGGATNRAREAAFLAAASWIVLIAYARAFTTGR